MTHPHIGNTGVNGEDPESGRPWVRGFVAREFARRPSSHRADGSLADSMVERNVVGIHGIDTRALTRLLREEGCMRGIIASGEALETLTDPVGAARKIADLSSLDPVREVTAARRYEWSPSRSDRSRSATGLARPGPTVAVLDCGAKRNILRSLHDRGARVVVFPATAPAREILDAAPDGLLVSNGPGDPRQAAYAIATLRELLGRLPIQGICLGHQILALAAGAGTFKLKYGHHGGNHPVLHGPSGRIEITSQNHNYAVDPDQAAAAGFEITHTSLFDGTVEGMVHRELGLLSVQYHPEAAPGPHDAAALWGTFLDHLGGKAR
jgi:carbamoyl-phosphate synthase small subunit